MSSKKSFKDTPKILLSNTLPTLIVLSKPLKKIQRNLARIIYIYIYIANGFGACCEKRRLKFKRQAEKLGVFYSKKHFKKHKK
jgi:uncharacterized membrane protein